MTAPDGGDMEVAEAIEKIRAFIDDPRPHDQARKIAANLAQQDHSSVEIIADACERLAAGAP